MKAKILEIFRSIQGEGPYSGVKQVFVRFFECNMHCVWCDTPHSIGDTTRRYHELTLDEVFKNIKELWDHSHSVSLTGGEPLLQENFIKLLLLKLKKAEMPVYLETNGVLPNELKEVIKGIDIVAMDIKLPSSTKCRPYWEEHKEFLKIARETETFIKTVISSDTDKNDIIKATDLVESIDPKILFILEPNYFEMKNGVVSKCLEFEKYCAQRLENVRVMPQMHKFLKVR